MNKVEVEDDLVAPSGGPAQAASRAGKLRTLLAIFFLLNLK
jgi:hypothetical protein